ncbi:hypothetical protein FOA43_003420 [Brettanomyces nanus]|uniref:Xylanolytic transcriptional activator regulatory domain-containing protein n=1 Tax=Eeniella nana TaxID=13502 RepID=A0A875SAP2_EENNA|nr:uncharacterized protein FOA43_003420 [Brettanomyces nanus]QPG76034.1 hypothetical protein FOA43_003420 [Brettanomyces nanus]
MMFLRFVRVQVPRVRQFSSSLTTRSILDYFKFYKKKDHENVPKQRPTEEVIKEVESGSKAIDAKNDVEILGRRDPRQFDKEVILEHLKGFSIPTWLPTKSGSEYAIKLNELTKSNEGVSISKLYTRAISEILKQVAGYDSGITELNDLSQRASILKQVQQKFRLEIPDPQIGKLNSFAKIEQYLTQKLDPSRPEEDELVPDKVYFDPAVLEGTNISVGSFVFEKQKAKTLKKLLKKAKKMEKRAIEEHQKIGNDTIPISYAEKPNFSQKRILENVPFEIDGKNLGDMKSIKKPRISINGSSISTTISNGNNQVDDSANDSSVSTSGRDIQTRLDHLENMIGILVSKLAPEASTESQYSQNSSFPATCISLPLVDTKQSSVPSSFSTVLESPKRTGFLSKEVVEKSIIAAAEDLERGPPTNAKVSERYERFFGGNTSISIFSSKGMKWMEGKVRDRKTTLPLRRLLSWVVHMEHGMLSVWVDPIEKSQIRPFPSRIVIEKLISEPVLPTILSRLMDIDTVRRLLKLYCDYRDGLIPEPRYTYSELLLMNCSLLVASSFYYERGHLCDGVDSKLNLTDLADMKKYLLDNSLFYYHRVSVVFDGLTGISGILLLSMYADFVSLSQSAYLMSTTAIRQAQDMGLHQGATYRGLPTKERNKRLFVWWMCYGYDRDLCVRSGKPPIINDDDVSAPSVPGFEAYWGFPSNQLRMSTELQYDLRTKLESMLSEGSICEVELYLGTQHFRLVARSYSGLLAANAFVSKSPSQLYECAENLLIDLELWRQIIPASLRPTRKLNPEFADIMERSAQDRSTSSIYRMYVFVCICFKYYHLKMTINKAIVKIKFSYEKSTIPKNMLSKVSIAEEEGMGTAMVILQMAGCMKSTEYANFALFYPFSSFIVVAAYCLQNPDRLTTKENVDCLIKASRNFFSAVPSRLSVDKWWVVDKIVRCVLYIVITTIVEHNPSWHFDCDDLLVDIKGLTVENDHACSATKTKSAFNSSVNDHPNTSRGKGMFCNVPVASLIAPPALDYSHSSSVSESAVQGRQQQVPLPKFSPRPEMTSPFNKAGLIYDPSTEVASPGNSFPLGDGNGDVVSDNILPDLELGSLRFDDSNDPKNINGLLELFSRNENNTPTNESEVSNSDTFQAEGVSLFQNMFNIPTMMLDMDGSSHTTLNSPQDIF